MTVLDAIFVKPVELFLGFVFQGLVDAGIGYGPALALLSLVVTTITAPVYYLAEKWKSREEAIQASMARDLASIKAHYSGQKRFYLIRNVHRLHGYNPISSLRTSLGLVIQIPFFFAAYQYLSRYHGYAGTGFLFVRDLALPDGLLWGVNLLPFAMTAVNVASSLLYTRSRSARDMAQLLGLAGVFLVLLYDQPAGLLVYWTMNNVLSIPKNALLATLLPPPPRAPAATAAGPSVTAAVRGWLVPANRPLILLVLTFLLLAAQRYWQLHYDRSFKYAILISAAAGVVLSCVWLFRYVRGARPGAGAARSSLPAVLIAQWLLFGAVAYLLLFARRQNAYLSNPTIKLLAVLIQDSIIYGASLGIWAPAAPGPGAAPLAAEAVPEHRTRLFACASAFVLAYLFVLSPALVYFSAPKDIAMTLGELLLRNAPAAALLGLLSLGLFRMLGRRAQVRAVEAAVAAALVILAYNYLVPGDYGILDELHLDRDFLLDEPRLSSFLLDVVVVALASFAARWIVRKRAAAVVPALVAFAAAFVVQVAVTGLRTERSALVIETPRESAELPAESAGVHSFSRDGANVLLVITDMFNGNYVDRLLREHPEYREKLDGFTWYSNTLSISSTTVTSIPSILAGPRYYPEAMNELPGSGRAKYDGAVRELCDAVLARGFDTSIVDLAYADMETLNKERYQGRLRISSASSYIGYWKARTGYAAADEKSSGKNRLLVMVALFQSTPYMLKAAVYDEGSWLIFRRSFQLRKVAANTVKTYAYLDLLPQLCTVSSASGTFKVIHTQFTHEPFGVTGQGTIIRDEFPYPGTGTRSFVDGNGAYFSAKKMVGFLVAWTNWFKAQGIYDNTFIVVMSDHGNNGRDSGLELPPGLDSLVNRWEVSRANALLLVKRFGGSGPLRTDGRFMTNADTAALLRNAAGDHATLGPEPAAGTPPAHRTLTYSKYYGNWNDFMASDREPLSTYVVEDDMHVPDNWRRE